MLSSLRPKIAVKGSSVYGVELNLGGSINRYWTLVQLALGNNKEVKIVRQEYIEEAFDAKQLADLNLKKAIPVILCITGTGVITGKLGDGDNVSSLFPGLDESETYHKEYQASSVRYASVIRKDNLANLIQQVTSQGFFVWDVALGALCTASILPLVQAPKQEFRLECFTIRLSPVAIEQNTVADELLITSDPCFVGTERTNTTMLPSLAAAISFFTGSGFSEEQLLKNRQQEYLAFKKSKFIGYSFLGLLLVVLLINFMLFSSYTKQLDSLQLALNDGQRQAMYLNTQKKELAEKQAILASMGIQREVPLSYIADRFAACTPEGIKLERMNINPITDKIKEHKPIAFTEGKLWVEGVCDNPDDLNLLLERLKKEEWLVKVDKKEYRENELKGRFILELSYE